MTSTRTGIRSGWVSGFAESPALLVHGGAWAIPYDESEAHLEGLRQAIRAGSSLLERGESAVEAVTAAVQALENHPAFDAGRGGVLNRDGEVELDAGIMQGATLAFGAVAGVKRIRNPITVARRLMEEDEGQARLLVGEGAERYAMAQGFDPVENRALVVEREIRRFELLRERERYHTSSSFLPGDTVGCVARDRSGHLAAATSTGGTPFTIPGRVGDSPLPGAGFYADDLVAVSATGWGEAIAAMSLSVRTADRIRAGTHPAIAASEWLAAMQARITNPAGEGATGGLIVIDALGRAGWAFTTPRMARGGWSEGTPAWVAL